MQRIISRANITEPFEIYEIASSLNLERRKSYGASKVNLIPKLSESID